MKKLAIFLTLCLLLPFFPKANADVISLPPDGFLEKNYQNAEHHRRSYYANGSEGYIRLYNQPGGSYITARTNGEVLYITFTYEHFAKLWGVIDLEGGKSEGWVPMDQLVLQYDSISFQEEHRDELYNSPKGYFKDYQQGDEVILWPYPNASGIEMKFAFPGETPEHLVKPSSPLIAYRDRDGLEWIYVSYLYGIRDIWICADDPYNEFVAAYPPPMPELIPPADPADIPPDNGFYKELALAGALVLFAVIVSIAFFKRFQKKV